jgi:hypothetical protein
MLCAAEGTETVHVAAVTVDDICAIPSQTMSLLNQRNLIKFRYLGDI